jgi:hypothetical protein
VAGTYGTILKTTDGGTNWTSQTCGTAYGLWSVHFIDRNTGWAVGQNGTILKTTTGGGISGFKKNPSSNSQFPIGFDLSQNFPNPFNPVTTIEFNLPKTSEVSLKVFNILGEEVATLVSKRLYAGSYSYEWDALNLASGVYLYHLETKDFVKTRKMILMK